MMRVPENLGLLGVLGRLHDADADRLLARALRLSIGIQMPPRLTIFGTVLGFDHANHGVHLMAPKLIRDLPHLFRRERALR